MANIVNWKNVFVDRMIKAGVSPEESQKIYQIEMGARSFFDFNGIVPSCFLLQNIEQDPEKIYYYWESRSVEARCPFCGTISIKPSKDYYTKLVQDIPCNNKAVYHVVRFNKYQCENRDVTTRNSLSDSAIFRKRMLGKLFDSRNTA